MDLGLKVLGLFVLQDTIVGLQALTEYALATQQANTDLQCSITAEEIPLGDWHVDHDNLLVLRAAEVRNMTDQYLNLRLQHNTNLLTT